MLYKHCNNIEDVELQVGKLDDDSRAIIEKQFNEIPDDWHNDIAYQIVDLELKQVMKKNFASDEDVRIVIVGSRIKNWMLGLDEANTLHILKLYNERRKNGDFLIDLFKDQEFDGGIEWKTKPTIKKEDRLAQTPLDRMYAEEDEVTRLMYDYLVQGDYPTLGLDSTSGLDKIMKGDDK